MKHTWVNHFFDHDPSRVRAGLVEYRALAERQLAWLDAPTVAVAYERLCADPRGTVGSLAELVGVDDRAAMTRAAGVVGRKKARARLLADRLRRKLSRRAA